MNKSVAALYLVLALSLTVFLASPSIAVSQLGVQKLSFCDSALMSAGIPFSGLSVAKGQEPSASTVTINFLPSATDDQKALAAAIVAGFPWSVNPPNLGGFITAIRADSAFTPEILVNMSSLLGLVQIDANDPVSAAKDWQNVLATYGQTSDSDTDPNHWLTNAIQIKILYYANAYNIPLLGLPSP